MIIKRYFLRTRLILPQLLSFLYFLTITLLSTSCVSYQSIINFSETEQLPEAEQPINNYQPITLKVNDVVNISVSSVEGTKIGIFDSDANGGFLINSDGFITYPIIGDVYLEGLTTNEAKLVMVEALSPYFVNPPVVQLSLTNFTINVNGEVGSPGIIKVPGERISMIDAITLAGDFTPYSSREDILLIRESNGSRTYHYINFNTLDVLQSPYYYLQQNDVLYIKPEKRKTGTVRGTPDRLIPYASVSVSLILLVTAIFNLR